MILYLRVLVNDNVSFFYVSNIEYSIGFVYIEAFLQVTLQSIDVRSVNLKTSILAYMYNVSVVKWIKHPLTGQKVQT